MPIFVYEPRTLYIFTTKDKAQGFIEAVDVRNNVYTEIYDAEGYLLNLSVTSDDEVIIEQLNPSLSKAENLKRLLYDFLKHGKQQVTDDWLISASLAELVTEAVKFKTR